MGRNGWVYAFAMTLVASCGGSEDGLGFTAASTTRRVDDTVTADLTAAPRVVTVAPVQVNAGDLPDAPRSTMATRPGPYTGFGTEIRDIAIQLDQMNESVALAKVSATVTNTSVSSSVNVREFAILCETDDGPKANGGYFTTSGTGDVLAAETRATSTTTSFEVSPDCDPALALRLDAPSDVGPGNDGRRIGDSQVVVLGALPELADTVGEVAGNLVSPVTLCDALEPSRVSEILAVAELTAEVDGGDCVFRTPSEGLAAVRIMVSMQRLRDMDIYCLSGQWTAVPGLAAAEGCEDVGFGPTTLITYGDTEVFIIGDSEGFDSERAAILAREVDRVARQILAE